MSKSAIPIDEGFFQTAAFILSTTIDIPRSPQQVWAALIDDRMGAWMSIIDHAHWQTPPPRHRGARRTVRVARFLTLDEEFFIWEDQRRIGFRAVDIRPALVSGWAEQGCLEPLPDGGTRINYTIAVEAPLLRLMPIPGFVMRAAALFARRAMCGIVSVLPPLNQSTVPSPGTRAKVRFGAHRDRRGARWKHTRLNRAIQSFIESR
jgi:hypothetical protein